MARTYENTLTIRLPRAEREKLDRLARESDRTASQIVRLLLRGTELRRLVDVVVLDPSGPAGAVDE